MALLFRQDGLINVISAGITVISNLTLPLLTASALILDYIVYKDARCPAFNTHV